MEFFGIKPIKLIGHKFESGFGYSKHATLIINKRKYVPVLSSQVINWGIKEVWKLTPNKVICKIIDKEEYLYLSAFTRDVFCPSKICGFTTIKLGNSPWGPYSNFEIGQVKDWRSILIDTKWNFKAKGTADLIFDLWITKNKTGVPKETDIELMVWLDYNNLEAYGKFAGYLDKFEILFSNVEEKREFLPELSSCGTISYYSTEPKGRIKFDLIKLILNSKRYFRIRNIKDYWIRTIDFGIEYLRNTKVEAKIYDLRYTFVR